MLVLLLSRDFVLFSLGDLGDQIHKSSVLCISNLNFLQKVDNSNSILAELTSESTAVVLSNILRALVPCFQV